MAADLRISYDIPGNHAHGVSPAHMVPHQRVGGASGAADAAQIKTNKKIGGPREIRLNKRREASKKHAKLRAVNV